MRFAAVRMATSPVPPWPLWQALTMAASIGYMLRNQPTRAPVAIVNACHSGQGGTGDVAILTAANRMQLMPFAQIATRIGGAITVTLVLVLLGRIA